MEVDYDNQSEWTEIDENASFLTLSLSVAAFDNHFNQLFIHNDLCLFCFICLLFY